MGQNEPRTVTRPLTSKPRDDEIDVYGLTHRGLVRPTNQDHFLICQLRKRMDVWLTSLPGIDELPAETERLAFLAMVADGVGGTARGEEASRRALSAITQYLMHSMHCYYTADSTDDEAFAAALQEAALQCHSELMESIADDASGSMATTLTVWLGRPDPDFAGPDDCPGPARPGRADPGPGGFHSLGERAIQRDRWTGSQACRERDPPGLGRRTSPVQRRSHETRLG